LTLLPLIGAFIA